MNIDRILKLADKLEDVPQDYFDMNSWGSAKDCGTPACVAGWTVRFFNLHDRARLVGTRDAAMEFLELDIMQDEDINLFFPEVPHPGALSPKQAACVLRAFASTGRVDWSAT